VASRASSLSQKATLHFAALTITKGDKALEPIYLLKLRYDLLLGEAYGVVEPIWGTLQRGHSGVHAAVPPSGFDLALERVIPFHHESMVPPPEARRELPRTP